MNTTQNIAQFPFPIDPRWDLLSRQTRSAGLILGEEAAEEQGEPGGKGLGPASQQALDPGQGHPAPGTDLLRVGEWDAGKTTAKDVEVFVLRESRGRVPGLVGQLGKFLQGGSETKFLPQPPLGGVPAGLSRAGMTTAGIRPELGEVILAIGTPLEQ